MITLVLIVVNFCGNFMKIVLKESYLTNILPVFVSRRGFKGGGVTGVRPPNLQQIIGYEGAVPH